MKLQHFTMENSLNNQFWGDLFADPTAASSATTPFRADAQKNTEQPSVPNEGVPSEPGDWTLGSRNTINLPPITSPRRRENTHLSASTSPQKFFNPNQRGFDAKVARLCTVVTGLLDRINEIEEA